VAQEIMADALAGIKDRRTLFALLHDKLDWPLDPEDTFIYANQAFASMDSNVGYGQMPPFSANDPFVFVLAEFQGKFRRRDLRQILRDIRTEMRTKAKYAGKGLENIIFVCTGEAYKAIRFAHFKEREGRQPEIRAFGWERGDTHIHTLCEFNLSALRFPADPADGPAWLKRWWSAFDVQAVSEDFFKRYEACFHDDVKPAVNRILCDEQKAEEFSHLLLNRLMFCWFIQKKGWLNGQKDYLLRLLERACRLSPPKNFYDTYLVPLFFQVLNNPEEERHKRVPGDPHVVFEAPFLNGGLFEETDLDREIKGAPALKRLPNSVFQSILEGLFASYNFTVEESTPLDVEVALDPELLGTIFERLVNKDRRHDTGSYYTPKPIVSFMCREALKGYLKGHDKLVDEHDPIGIDVPKARTLLARLDELRVVDPACGSGAYLLGMLHELHAVMRVLDTRAGRRTARDDYNRKLSIIENNIYGVDIAEFAVSIARLRLWLSLVVEYDGTNPPPLPNLEFKIECGDSLLAPDPRKQGQQVFGRDPVGLYTAKRALYMTAHGAAKKTLGDEIATLRREIAEWVHQGKSVPGFDWQVEFAEVFAPQEPLTTIGGAFNFGQELAERPKPGGFDIVLANPPFVRQERIKDIKSALKTTFGDLYSGTADLYVFFYLRALQLLKPGGMLAFISSNKWFRAKYGGKLREHIAETCSVSSITDFGELPVFTAATFPMIFVARKGQEAEARTVFTQVKSLDEPYPDVRALIDAAGQAMPASAFNGANWTMKTATDDDLLQKLRSAGPPLGEIVKGKLYRGVLTGLNQAFVISGAKRAELVAKDPKSAEIIKPLTVGDDIRKWRIDDRDRWLIFTPWDLNIHLYTAIKEHLLPWKSQLETRPECVRGIYHWWCLERFGATYRHLLDLPKIVYPQIMMEPRFTWDSAGVYLNQKCFLIASSDNYILGVLNSSAVWHYLKSISVCIGDPERRGRLEPRREDISSIPIPPASDSDRAAISALVQKCLDAKGVGCEAWEKEIDDRVAALYGL